MSGAQAGEDRRSIPGSKLTGTETGKQRNVRSGRRCPHVAQAWGQAGTIRPNGVGDSSLRALNGRGWYGIIFL